MTFQGVSLLCLAMSILIAQATLIHDHTQKLHFNLLLFAALRSGSSIFGCRFCLGDRGWESDLLSY